MNIERPTSNFEWEKMKKQEKVEMGRRGGEKWNCEVGMNSAESIGHSA